MRWFPRSLVTALLVSIAAGATEPRDPVTAEVLFHEAKRLLSEGRYDEACARLADSHRMDPAGGTVLALAMCHEAAARLASAWTYYNEALSLALRDAHAERERRAREGLASVEPRLSRIAIEPADATLSGLVIERDGLEVPKTAWGVPVAIDAGRHAITARAPGHEPLSIPLEGPREGETLTVRLPALAATTRAADGQPEPVPRTSMQPRPPTMARTPSAPADTRTLATTALGYGLLGVGAASIVMGSVFGISAMDAAARANDRCPAPACADPEAVALADRAGRDATVSTITIAVGIGALLGGGYLVFFSRAGHETTGFDLRVRPGRAQVSAGGTF